MAPGDHIMYQRKEAVNVVMSFSPKMALSFSPFS